MVSMVLKFVIYATNKHDLYVDTIQII